jgi:hypothetical protein
MDRRRDALERCENTGWTVIPTPVECKPMGAFEPLMGDRLWDLQSRVSVCERVCELSARGRIDVTFFDGQRLERKWIAQLRAMAELQPVVFDLIRRVRMIGVDVDGDELSECVTAIMRLTQVVHLTSGKHDTEVPSMSPCTDTFDLLQRAVTNSVNRIYWEQLCVHPGAAWQPLINDLETPSSQAYRELVCGNEPTVPTLYVGFSMFGLFVTNQVHVDRLRGIECTRAVAVAPSLWADEECDRYRATCLSPMHPSCCVVHDVRDKAYRQMEAGDDPLLPPFCVRTFDCGRVKIPHLVLDSHAGECAVTCAIEDMLISMQTLVGADRRHRLERMARRWSELGPDQREYFYRELRKLRKTGQDAVRAAMNRHV